MIGYLRVSTQKQDYGLDAQKADILQAYPTGVEFYTEKASGKRDDRPVLSALIERAKQTKETIVVSKLDRLSRSMVLSANLLKVQQEYGFTIQCLNPPINSTLEWGIFSALAQHERELISERTKKGLAVARENGKLIGTPGHKSPVVWTDSMRKKQSAIVTDIKARESAETIRKVKDLAELGKPKTYQQLSDMLNKMGIKTIRGKEWSRASTGMFCKRHDISL